LEARLSPFFHERIYGFFQHDFVQAMRNGGFRAFVFMSHGLAVAFFVSQALTGVAGLSRLRDAALPLPHKLSLLVLGVALVTCKSVGAMLYAIVTVPLTLLASAKAQARVAGWLALAVISYPMLRVFDWISLDWFLEQAQRVGADRAQSLEFRFVNESALLARAQERPLLGWGTWGRNLIFDPFSGRDLSVIDGEWILQLGSFGILGYLISFGLLLWPVWAVARLARRRDLAPSLQQALATFSLMLAFLGLDLIPNSISHGIPFWMAGALTATTAPLLRQRATT
jgi:hypothetical protein